MIWRDTSLFRCAVLGLEITFEKINVLDLRNSMNMGWAHPKHRKYKKSLLTALFSFDNTCRQLSELSTKGELGYVWQFIDTLAS